MDVAGVRYGCDIAGLRLSTDSTVNAQDSATIETMWGADRLDLRFDLLPPARRRSSPSSSASRSPRPAAARARPEHQTPVENAAGLAPRDTVATETPRPREFGGPRRPGRSGVARIPARWVRVPSSDYDPASPADRWALTTGELPFRTSPRVSLGSGTVHMLVATLVSAAGAYLFLLMVGRALGPTDFAPITALWTMQYLVTTTVFGPMAQLTVRRLSREKPEATPWALYLWVTTACVLGVLLFSRLTLDRFFGGNAVYLFMLAPLIIGYAGFAIGRGYLAGHLRFKEYAFAIAAESLVRLCLAGALVLAGVGTLGLSATMAAAPLVIWLWHPFRGRQQPEASRAREQGATTALGALVSASAASHTILAAGPLVIGVLGASAAEVSVLGQTLLLLRAPLALASNMISRVMPPLMRLVETSQWGRIGSLNLWMGVGGSVTSAAGFGVGYLTGPRLVELLMGPEYRPGALLAGLAAAATVLAGVALFVQQILIATGSTSRVAVAWFCGLVVAVAAVVVAREASPSLRVGWGFLLGEALAFVLLIAAVGAVAGSRQSASAPGA
jgi:O-antigen/teichoic acid export membrane protein